MRWSQQEASHLVGDEVGDLAQLGQQLLVDLLHDRMLAVPKRAALAASAPPALRLPLARRSVRQIAPRQIVPRQIPLQHITDQVLHGINIKEFLQPPS